MYYENKGIFIDRASKSFDSCMARVVSPHYKAYYYRPAGIIIAIKYTAAPFIFYQAP